MTPRPGDPGWPQLYPDAPWRMRGRHVTARFAVDEDTLRRCVHPAIKPVPAAEMVARLRFWQLSYESLAPSDGELACSPTGSFGEAIVAFPGSFEGRATETASFLWSDSDVYLTWGRELFGWPTLRCDLTLEGNIWGASPVAPGSRGGAVTRVAAGTMALHQIVVGEPSPLPASGPDPSFVTVRRTRQLGRPASPAEAVLTTMRVIDRGHRFAATGRIALDMAPGHPLQGLAHEPISIEIVDGVDCVVGDDVRVGAVG